MKGDRAARAATQGAGVALLRGINVGRAKRVAMSDLRALFEALGYGSVRTLLNSGNVVFSSGPKRGGDPGAIEKAMVARLGVASRITLLTAAELDAAIRRNPLPVTDPSRLLVAFLQSAADTSRLRELMSRDWGPESLSPGPRVVYLGCPNGITGGELVEAVGKALGDRVTMRNWATVIRLQAMLGDPPR